MRGRYASHNGGHYFQTYRENNREGLCRLRADSRVPCAKGYGRIIRAQDGALVKIVEERDASEEEKKINEVNTSVYCFQVKALRGVLSGLKTDNAQGELYLTDALELLRAAGARTGGIQAEDYREAMGNKRSDTACSGWKIDAGKD